MTEAFRTKLAAAAVLVSVFGAGVAVGFALDRGMARASAGERGEVRAEARDARPDGEGERWIIDRIGLSAGQRAEVDSVIRHYGGRMTDLQKEFRPKYRAVVDSTNEAVRELLDEDQRARYDELAEQRRERRDRASRGDD